MPPRYTDELRRITREQGGPLASEPPSRSGVASHAQPGVRARLITAVFVIVLVGSGWLLIRQLMFDSKLQDCVMSGRKNCAPVDVDSTRR